MKTERQKNPLRRRVLRELAGDWRKYLLVALFLILTIGFVSGMYVANGSMLMAASDGKEKYQLEDGYFELKNRASDELLKGVRAGEMADLKAYFTKKAQEEVDEGFDNAVGNALSALLPEAADSVKSRLSKEAEKKVQEEYEKAADRYGLEDADFQAVPAQICENFFVNTDETWGDSGNGTVRVYQVPETIDLPCMMAGRLPEKEDEIAIDRMHADNAKVKVGDSIAAGGKKYTVTGLIALPNYATLHENATDFMFDALTFDVALVTEDGFRRLGGDVHYNYAFRYDSRPADEGEEKERSDNFAKALLTQAAAADNELESFIPAYANPAVHFATDDMASDESMGGVLLDILVVILAFIFAVTVVSTMTKESAAIGTLRASGYTRCELIRHYLSMPLAVILVSAAVGNLLGYTVFKNVVVGMYYNSYSLPTYRTVWNPDAFLRTTLIPVILMMLVNAAAVGLMMRHTPLEFLRHDLKRRKRKKAVRLPHWRFLSRFRLRVFFQNIPNYVILFVGILFIMVLQGMAVGVPSSIRYYQNHAAEMTFANYQYVLKDYENPDGSVVTTDNPDAEPFCMTSLLKPGKNFSEEVSVYGIVSGSRYVDAPDSDGALVSAAVSEKYRLGKGDTLKLEDEYTHKAYEFRISGIVDSCRSIAVFLSAESFRDTFDWDEAQFTGYLSDTEITDLPEKDVAVILTDETMTKMADQLDHSMGSYMEYFEVLCVLLSMVLIYLLTKLVIERNEQPISMVKILGYRDGEIGSIYLRPTTVLVCVFSVICAFLGSFAMKYVWAEMMLGYNGWLQFRVDRPGYAEMILFVIAGYLIVRVTDMRRIRRIPMDEALKNME